MLSSATLASSLSFSSARVRAARSATFRLVLAAATPVFMESSCRDFSTSSAWMARVSPCTCTVKFFWSGTSCALSSLHSPFSLRAVSRHCSRWHRSRPDDRDDGLGAAARPSGVETFNSSMRATPLCAARSSSAPRSPAASPPRHGCATPPNSGDSPPTARAPSCPSS